VAALSAAVRCESVSVTRLCGDGLQRRLCYLLLLLEQGKVCFREKLTGTVLISHSDSRAFSTR